MAQVFNDNADIRAPKLHDRRTGPWVSIGAAYAGVLLVYRKIGLSAFIIQPNGSVVEYWYRDNTTTLVIKGGAGGVSPAAPVADAILPGPIRTEEDLDIIATKINELLANLRTAGFLTP